jgi:hypothetical protein
MPKNLTYNFLADPTHGGELTTRMGTLIMQVDSDRRWKVQDFIFELLIEDDEDEPVSIIVENQPYPVQRIHGRRSVLVQGLEYQSKPNVVRVKVHIQGFEQDATVPLNPGRLRKP